MLLCSAKRSFLGRNKVLELKKKCIFVILLESYLPARPNLTIKTWNAHFPLQSLPLHTENVMFVTWLHPLTQTDNFWLQSDLINIPCSYSCSRFLHLDHVSLACTPTGNSNILKTHSNTSKMPGTLVSCFSSRFCATHLKLKQVY